MAAIIIFFRYFPPSHKHIVLLTCPPCTSSHYLSHFMVNRITLIKSVPYALSYSSCVLLALLSIGIDINQHRGSISRHYFASLTVKKSLRLTVVDVFCFILFARYGIRALPLMTFCSLFNFNARLPCEIRESVAGRKSVEPTFDSDSSAIDICKYLFFNSVSFLHLNNQSSVPKLDFIVAEYSCHDILSFTESWLKPDISTDSLELPCYKPPYRRDRVYTV